MRSRDSFSANTRMTQTRLVILGGGFGGLSVARRLFRKRLGDRIAITIVDQHQESVYTPWLHEVAAGTVHASAIHDAEIDFVSIRGIRYRRATVRGIDRVARHVLCDDDSTIPYDILVCAFGSVTNDFGIVGARTFTCDVKRPSDAMHIREQLALLLQRASQGTRQRFLVIGNGANGTECISEVASMVNTAVFHGVCSKNDVDLTLVGTSPEPLAMLPSFLRRKTVRRLERLGVRCSGSLALVSVRDGSALLQPVKDGMPVGESVSESFDCCVTALGVKVPDVVHALPFEKNERGRILVNETLRVLGESAVFGLGDSVAVHGAMSDPQTAQAAVYQSRWVACNIAAMIAQRPLATYRPRRSWSMIFTLGKNYAVGTLFGVPVWGYTVAILRRVIDAQYFFLATSWTEAMRRMVRGFLTYAKARNINV